MVMAESHVTLIWNVMNSSQPLRNAYTGNPSFLVRVNVTHSIHEKFRDGYLFKNFRV